MNYLLIVLLFTLSFAQNTVINIMPLSEPRFYITLISLQNQGLVFYAGGIDLHSKCSSLIDVFNASTNLWSVNYLSQPRYYISSSSLDNFNLVFFAGGAYYIDNFNTLPSNRIDIFNANTNTWSQANLSVPRYQMTSVSLQSKGLSFFAGGVNSKEIDVVDIYNAYNNSWTTAKLSIARDSLASTSLESQGLVFFAGGDDAYGNTYSIIDVYNCYTNQWSISYLSQNRTFLTAITLQNYGLVFFAGGKTNQFSNLNTVSNVIDVYNASSSSWNIMYLSNPRFLLGSATLENSGLVYFGYGYSWNFQEQQFTSTTITDVYNVSSGSFKKSETYLSVFGINIPPFYMTALQNYNLVFSFNFDFNNLQVVSLLYNSCQAGFQNNILLKTNNNNNLCLPCQAGYYANIGSLFCLQAPAGYYSLGQAEYPSPTFPGCYSNKGSFFKCEYVCPIGSYCPSPSTAPNLCPPGFVCPKSSLSSPIPCPSGTYNQNSGSISKSNCITCPVGSYCNQNISASNIIPCPAQYFCKEGSTSFKNPCPGGFYCPFATNNILECPVGSYCPPLSASPLLCPSGSMCPSTSSVAIPCKGGYQCPAGSSFQTICPKNTFASPSSGSCTPCPNNEFTIGEGSSSCLQCPISKWNTDGWYCMTEVEKTVFIGGWLLTVFSLSLSSWKTYYFSKGRIKKIKNNGLKLNLRNFIFLGSELKKINQQELKSKHNLFSYNISEDNDNNPLLKNDVLLKMQESIIELQKEVFILKNKDS